MNKGGEDPGQSGAGFASCLVNPSHNKYMFS
jgi:hypothetical protein